MLNSFLEDLRDLPRKYKKLLLIFSDFFLVVFSSFMCEFILIGYFPQFQGHYYYIFFLSLFFLR